MAKTADELFDDAMTTLNERRACRWLAFCWGFLKDRASASDLERIEEELNVEKRMQADAEARKKGMFLF